MLAMNYNAIAMVKATPRVYDIFEGKKMNFIYPIFKGKKRDKAKVLA